MFTVWSSPSSHSSGPKLKTAAVRRSLLTKDQKFGNCGGLHTTPMRHSSKAQATQVLGFRDWGPWE